ncbi:MAG: hypothetical protein U0441_34050 [Polyangiaceae bacterium]
MVKRGAAAFSILPLVALACSGAPKDPAGPKSGAQGSTSVKVTADRLDGSRLLAEDAALAIHAGAGPLQLVAADIASEGDRLGAFVEIPADQCLVAYARPSPTISDVDLFAYEDDGTPFSTDESPSQGGTVLVCPPHPKRLYVVGRVMAGAGLLAIGVQPVPAPKADAVASAVHAHGLPGEDSGRLDAWPGLETKLREHRAAIGGKWDDVRRVAMPVTQRAVSRISITLEPNRCADVLLAPSDEVDSLDAFLEDEHGRVISRARERGKDRSAVICTTTRTEISVAMRPRASEGLVAVVLGRSAKGAAAEVMQSAFADHVTSPLDLDAARAALDRLLDGRGFGARKLAGTATARTGQRQSVTIDVPAGCARVDVIAGKPLGTFRAELWDDASALVTSAYGGARGTFFACGKGGSWRADVEALDAPGPFAVEVRKDRSAPPALVAHPLAAARLLGRIEAEGVPIEASAAQQAQVLALDATSLRAHPLTIAAGTCATVIAALDSGGNGLDLRLVDTATNESSLVRGATVASDRLCAATSARSAKAELRLTSGKADALVLVRTSAP